MVTKSQYFFSQYYPTFLWLIGLLSVCHSQRKAQSELWCNCKSSLKKPTIQHSQV